MTFLNNNPIPSVRRLLRSRGIKRLTKAMSSLPEPKQAGKARHPTWRCLLIVLLSLVSGRNWVLDAHSFAERHERKLAALFGEGYSTLSYCTLVRALHRIGPEAGCPLLWRWAFRLLLQKDATIEVPRALHFLCERSSCGPVNV